MKSSGARTRRRHLSFQKKLLLSYIMVVFIPTVFWGGLSYMQTNRSLLSQARSSFNELYANVFATVDQRLSSLESTLSLVAADSALVRTLSQNYTSNYAKYYDVRFRLDPLLDAILWFHSEIEAMDFYVPNTLQHTRSTFHSLEDAERLPEYAKLSRSYEAVWHHEQDRLYISKRLLDPQIFSAGPIIRVTLPAAFLTESLMSAELKGYTLAILDESGCVVASLSPPGHTPAVPDAASDKPGVFTNASALSVPGWTLYMQTDQSAGLPSWWTVFQFNLVLLVTIAALMLAVSAIFSRSFSRRIHRLNDFLARAPLVRFSEDIESKGGDEIDDIINRVGRMARESRTLIQEVYEGNIQRRKAEIKALQSQINPHFLYNTLSKINWISIRNGDEDTSYIVTALSKFYRSTLNHGNMVTTVRDEVETTKAYVDIQLYVLDHAFRVTYRVDEAIMDYNLPSIILQPIVENAIEHGIRMKEPGTQGELTLSGYMDGHDILFEITDNGPGLTQQQIAEIFSRSGHGYGVKNVNDRLRLFFDDGYGLRFQPNPAGGCRVIIRIPQYVELSAQDCQQN